MSRKTEQYISCDIWHYGYPSRFNFPASIKGRRGNEIYLMHRTKKKRWCQFKKLAKKLKSQRVNLFLKSYIGMFTSEALNHRQFISKLQPDIIRKEQLLQYDKVRGQVTLAEGTKAPKTVFVMNPGNKFLFKSGLLLRNIYSTKSSPIFRKNFKKLNSLSVVSNAK